MDASNLLKPALQSGSLRCIGSTTYKEYRQHFEKDRALVRRFQKIDIKEPSVEDTIEILKGLRPVFEDYHKLKYTPMAIKSAVELSARYIHDRKLPDKAIDVIDETGAAQMLTPPAKRKKSIGVREVEATVARMARIPPKSVSKNDAAVLRHMERDLKRVVFGQDKAIEALASAIKLSRAGLREPEKPIGSYLFSGPTGVGKTEVARQLASLMGVELLRFDMSEYMERHTVSRLIGAPPGYVGFDQGGLLTDGVDQHPHCVLLLDEIEKAHPDLFNILLQVMDHGKLTDHNGKTVDFRNVILIMTTNAGAADLARAPIGFNRTRREGDDEEAINRLFTPEFRNRLDAVVPFEALSREVVRKVVEKFIFQLEAQLGERNAAIELTEEANDWIAARGYDQRYGARPLSRVIQEHIKKPLAEELLFGKLQNGGIVQVVVEKVEKDKPEGTEGSKDAEGPKDAEGKASGRKGKAASSARSGKKAKAEAEAGGKGTEGAFETRLAFNFIPPRKRSCPALPSPASSKQGDGDEKPGSSQAGGPAARKSGGKGGSKGGGGKSAGKSARKKGGSSRAARSTASRKASPARKNSGKGAEKNKKDAGKSRKGGSIVPRLPLKDE